MYAITRVKKIGSSSKGIILNKDMLELWDLEVGDFIKIIIEKMEKENE